MLKVTFGIRSIAFLPEIPIMSLALSVPEKHQLRIARDTLKMSDIGARIMGGPSKEEARAIILRLTGKPAAG